MGSQVRILYRPPSKAQVRGVKPLAFFFLTPKMASKLTSQSNPCCPRRRFLNALHVRASFTDVIFRFFGQRLVYFRYLPAGRRPGRKAPRGHMPPPSRSATGTSRKVFQKLSLHRRPSSRGVCHRHKLVVGGAGSGQFSIEGG